MPQLELPRPGARRLPRQPLSPDQIMRDAKTLLAAAPPAPSKSKAPIDLVNETPHDRFIRLANQRSKPIIKYLRMLGQLGTPSYQRTAEEVDRIEAALQTELTKAITKLRASTEKTEIGDIL